MQYILQNFLAIAVATLAGLLLSGLYAAAGRRGGEGRRRRAVLAALAVVTQGWLCAILAGALILAPPQAGAWTMALGSGGRHLDRLRAALGAAHPALTRRALGSGAGGLRRLARRDGDAGRRAAPDRAHAARLSRGLSGP